MENNMPKKPDERKSKKVVLSSSAGYGLELYNVPEDVTPELLPVSEEDHIRLKGEAVRKDGNIGLITSVAANLVFYDRNRKIVNYFSSPVKLVYNFTSDDESKRKERRAALTASGNLRRNQKVQLIPIYLYSYFPEKPKEMGEEKKPEFEFWQPFQDFTINEERKTVTVKFMFWGDAPTGWGTRP
jgi:hypothetical protein